ncbi:MAG: hypothetical protein ACRDT6_14605 [Micromonosporaceae bacterium]
MAATPRPCPTPQDPLFPAAGLLPLAEPGGGYTPLANRPGSVRPFAATIAVPPPIEAKKHDTSSTRWTENKPTQVSRDGQVVPDTTPIVHTDT